MAIDLLVNIDVDNLDKAIAFYTDAFDRRVGRRFGDAGVELLGASSPFYLLVKPAGSKASIATPNSVTINATGPRSISTSSSRMCTPP